MAEHTMGPIQAAQPAGPHPVLGLPHTAHSCDLLRCGHPNNLAGFVCTWAVRAGTNSFQRSCSQRLHRLGLELISSFSSSGQGISSSQKPSEAATLTRGSAYGTFLNVNTFR